MNQTDADELLANEKLIAQVLEIRKSPDPPQQTKTWKELIFETAGGTALITVLIGGVLGTLLTLVFQYSQKKYETQHLDHQAELDRERSDHERIEKLRLDAAKDLFELTFRSISASEDALQLSTLPFADSKLKAQRESIRKSYNDADVAWRDEHGVKSMLFIYYNRGFPDIAEEWGKTDKSVSRYMDCTEAWVTNHPFYTNGLGPGCSDEKKVVDTDIANLQTALVQEEPEHSASTVRASWLRFFHSRH
jgi:hypothetical protein